MMTIRQRVVMIAIAIIRYYLRCLSGLHKLIGNILSIKVSKVITKNKDKTNLGPNG